MFFQLIGVIILIVAVVFTYKNADINKSAFED